MLSTCYKICIFLVVFAVLVMNFICETFFNQSQTTDKWNFGPLHVVCRTFKSIILQRAMSHKQIINIPLIRLRKSCLRLKYYKCTVNILQDI